MRLSAQRAHLGYCTNIHPGESWPEVRAALESELLRVRARVAPGRSFGIGLRLSALAARQLEARDELARFQAWLGANDLYVFTINGFVHGTFHGTRVKERVYLPDWRDPERVEYSDRLARLLAALLPADVAGSVSSVPLGFRSELHGEAALEACASRLLDHAAGLARLEAETGRRIALALEPEPCCTLETVAEAAAYFARYLRSDAAEVALAARAGLSRAQSAAALRAHLGLCLDACHAAVEFEEPAAVLAALAAVEVEVKKLQLSSGLRIARDGPRMREALGAFVDQVYLHQVVVRDAAGELARYVDLDEALAQPIDPLAEWRVHFHVPIFRRELGAFDSTQAWLAELLATQRSRGVSQQLEVETYTWQVLPPALRQASVCDDIARELEWVLDALDEPRG
jgi:sugar phosphate isomerase/epimerase